MDLIYYNPAMCRTECQRNGKLYCYWNDETLTRSWPGERIEDIEPTWVAKDE